MSAPIKHQCSFEVLARYHIQLEFLPHLLVPKPYSNALKLQDQFITCRLDSIRIDSLNAFVVHDCGSIVAVYRRRYKFHLCFMVSVVSQAMKTYIP